jgi:translocation and assembly module TamB
VTEPAHSTRDTPGDQADGPGAEGAAPSRKRKRQKRQKRDKRKRRLRRAIGWSLLALLLLVAAVLTGTVVTLGRLDNPTISGLLRDRLAQDYDLDISYDALSVDVFGGLHLENLRLRTPAPYTPHAPDLLHIARVDASWDVWSLMSGAPRLGEIDVEGVTVSVVVDEHGGSSLVELARRFPPSEEEPAVVPLSHLVKDSLPALAVDALSVRDVGMELVQIQQNQVQRRIALTGVCLGGPFQARPGVLATELRLGSCDQGLKVSVLEPGAPDARPRELVVRLDHDVTTPGPDRVRIAIHGQLVRQDLMPEVALPEEIIRARADVHFDPVARRTSVELGELSLLDGVFTAEARMTLDDLEGGATAPSIERLAGRLDGSRLAALAPGLLTGVTLADTELTYEVTGLAIDAASGLPTRGNVAVRGDIGSARVDRDGQKLALDQAHLAFDLELPPQAPQAPPAPDAPQVPEAPAAPEMPGQPGQPLAGTLLGKLQTSLRVERLDTDMAGQRASVRQLDVSLAGSDLTLNVANPQASRGTLTLAAALAGAEAALPDIQAELGAMRLTSEITAGDPAAGIRAHGELPLASVALTQRGGPRVRGRDLSVSWRVDGLDPEFARPADIQADARVGKLDLADAGQTVKVSDARAKIRAGVRSPTSFDARVELPVAEIDVRTADGVALALRGLDLGVRADDMILGDEALPRGRLALTSSLPRLSARTPTARAEGKRIELTAEARLAGNGPLTLSGTLPLGSLEVHDTTAGASGKRLLDLGETRLAWRVEDLVMHPTDPLRTRGRVHIEGSLPEIDVPGERMTVAVPRLALDATLHGARKAYDAKLRMTVRANTRQVKQVRRTDLVASVDAHADLRAPAARLRFDLRPPDGGDEDVVLAAHLDAGFTAAQRRLAYELGLRAERLEVIGALLPASVRSQHQVDWNTLRVRVDGRGEVRDLVQRFVDGAPVLADDALTALRGEQELTVDVQGLDYRADKQRLQLPGLTLRLSAARKDDAAHALVDLRLPRMELAVEDKTIEVVGLVHRLDVSSPGALETSRLTLALATEIEKVSQPFIGYPVEKATLSLRGHLDHLAALHVEELLFDNPAGATRLTATMALDQPVVDTGAIPGRQALTLSGTLRQDLGRISLGPNSPRLRGRVAVPFQVESGDLSAFLVGLRAELDDVHVALGLPGTGIAVQGLTGRVPVLVELALLPGGGVRILEGPAKNLYSRTRFLDVHPFLRGEHFLSIDKVWFMDDAIGPIAGNLRVERDSLALDQLQLGFLGGNITGQLVVDYRNGKPRVLFRGNATGLRPGKDGKEVLDANAALVFSPDPLALEGRMQVVRMSRQHLFAMLDIIDPFHEDPDFNKVRLGLRLGHPKFLRLRMKDGFLDVKVDLGGAANVIRIDEIRGIALGPLLNLYVAPVLAPILAPPPVRDDEDAVTGEEEDDDDRVAGEDEDSAASQGGDQPTAPSQGAAP